MTIAAHPKEYESCPECGSEKFTKNKKVRQIGTTYTCDDCGTELYVYDNSGQGMGDSLTWAAAEPVILALGQRRECKGCGYAWQYGGSSDRPTCPACKGKRTVEVN